ncbi:DNA-cytosine methyltransferase, putative [Babesia ovata]|uniref:DNA-cytosine methyltransferase, putative n=1 Tax=Babesia ovata TaxID=189622 RepID=A0A2H6KAL5_9APIC|nr:DNA-cytosine methyltransferase, putative [Babesia ovata]GBE60033.1 DNA-cytosine methyltransferase, putative [Babesia ovata]
MSRARFTLLGASATLATAASGYLLYESLYVPSSVRAAVAEISDWSVEESGNDAVVRVNASGSKAGGMFTCNLSRIEGSWKVVTLDVIYHEPRKEPKLESAAVYDELEKALAK